MHLGGYRDLPSPGEVEPVTEDLTLGADLSCSQSLAKGAAEQDGRSHPQRSAGGHLGSQAFALLHRVALSAAWILSLLLHSGLSVEASSVGVGR